ncbi:MAG: universal stress protein [Desulfobacca sp.]|uniref:universal stress protein n=1 Tax=Desulfobacca sp. TaxID=2067990 RepID=UPI00404B244D
MFKRIILATDLSPAWDEIISCAGEFKALGCTDIILTHVITVLFLSGMEGAPQAEAREKLAAQKARLEAQGFAVGIEIPTGLPAHSLNEVARCCGADLIVLGSHGRALWREAVLGSVSAAVLHHLEYPTLLLNVQLNESQPAGTCRLKTTAMLRHILYPTDFSSISERVGDYLSRLAPLGTSQVTVLHALDLPVSELNPPGYQESAAARAQDALQAVTQHLQAAGIPKVTPVLAPGHPLPAILRLLASTDISLIIMGTQGRGFLKEIFLGSVAHNVSRLAPCPVLFIPPASREA